MSSSNLPFLKAVFTPSGINCVQCATVARGQVLRIWALCLIMLIASGILNMTPPNVHFMLISDTRYHYPLLHETFPSYICVLIAVGLPAIAFILPHIASSSPYIRNLFKLQYPTENKQLSCSNRPLLSQPFQTSLKGNNNTDIDGDGDGDGDIDDVDTDQSRSNSDLLLHADPCMEGCYNDDFRWYRGLLANSSSFFGLIVTTSSTVFITTLLKTITGRPRPNAIALSLHRHLKSTPQFVDNPLNKEDPKVHIAQALSMLTSIPTSSSLTPAYKNGAGSVLGSITPPSEGKATSEMIGEFMRNNIAYSKESSYNHLLVNEALRSFPSGHSSFTFGCMIYLILVLIDKYHTVYDTRDIKSWFLTSSRNQDKISYKRSQNNTQNNGLNNRNNQNITPETVQIQGQISSNASTAPHTTPISQQENSKSFCARIGRFFLPIIRPILYVPELAISPNYVSDCGCKARVDTRSGGNIVDGENIGSNAISTQNITDKIGNNNSNNNDDMLLSSYQNTTSYLSHKIHPNRATAYAFYVIIPLLLASTVAISRIWDYWHHADDVLAGSLLGIGCAFAVRKMLR